MIKQMPKIENNNTTALQNHGTFYNRSTTELSIELSIEEREQ
jgi:hypothetical protein